MITPEIEALKPVAVASMAIQRASPVKVSDELGVVHATGPAAASGVPVTASVNVLLPGSEDALANHGAGLLGWY